MSFSSKKKATMRNVMRMLFLLTVFFVTHVFAEEVCKFEYLGAHDDYNDSTIVVPEKVVAMSEYVRIGAPSDIIYVGNPCSIFFIVDNSASNLAPGTDKQAIRYKVVSELIDSIYERNSDCWVGLGIFGGRLYFDPRDDQIFERLTSVSTIGAFIPLLQLNKTYGSRTGREILQYYLRIHPTAFDWWELIYEPSDIQLSNGLTNINIGLISSQDAFLKSPHAKDKHYNIFLSDGLATATTIPINQDQYVQGEILGNPLATTFTVYYNSDAGDLAKLNQMTQNIKTNGYSTSNQNLTNIWDMSMDHDALMNLLITNVISQIITNVVTFTTNNVDVNGLGPITGWDSTGFYFNNFFPLTGVETDFHYEIDYHVQKDSVTDNGDTITVMQFDTTHVIDYTVEIQDGAPVPDSVELTCWGRNLGFYYNGAAVSVITGEMNTVEVRFTEYEVDTLYGYKDVEVEITHTDGSPADVESFKMNDNGTYYTYTFPRVESAANSGDGILQHQNPDSVVVVFRNPKLPLDTLRYVVPFLGIDAYSVTSAIYFDNSADGHVDSLYLGISGKDVDTYAKEIMDNITLPAHRNFSIGGYSVVTGGIAVDVTENAAATLTYCTDEDVIAVDSVELDPDVVLLSSEVDIIDSMAPVIMTADLQDSALAGARDELTVTFSENVESITREKPFKFYSNADDKTYDGTLGVISQSGASGVFEVLSLDGVSRIMDGDSIRIHWIYDSNVNDGLGNDQDNGNNIRREINVTVVEKGMKVEWGVYFDNTADGFVDSIFIKITGKKVANHVDDLMGLIELPPHRAFTTNSYHYSTGGIAVDVEEKSGVELTMVDDRDVVVITKGQVFTDGESVIASEASIRDSIAPIIMKASYVDSLKTGGLDKLTIIFSETVEDITRDEPFSFYTIAGTTVYDVQLNTIGQNANRGIFEVTGISGVEQIEDGDSIRIYWIYDANVYDALGNNQDNEMNRRVEIAVDIIPDKYDLIPEALIYRVDNEYSMPANFYDIAELEEVLSNTAVGNGTHRGVTIITLRPDDTTKVTVDDSLSGKISIYDAVGNPIIINRKLGFDKARTRLVYIWDGRNELGRHVGPSGYVAVMPCTFYHKGKFKWDLPAKSIVVGVKE